MEDAVKERFPKNWTESLKKLQESNETAPLKMKPCGLKMKLSIKAVVFTHNGIRTLIESGYSFFAQNALFFLLHFAKTDTRYSAQVSAIVFLLDVMQKILDNEVNLFFLAKDCGCRNWSPFWIKNAKN
ncbi:MAG: hypothetical protein IKJ55_01150 [Clostridia bacterium]|nr:hypothetical protein [Clostridia bacterium]